MAARARRAEADDAAADSRDEQASADDEAAADRDRAAGVRDDRTARRGRDAHDEGMARGYSLDRRPAARDRKASADDREAGADDRDRSRRDRHGARHERERASDDRDAAADVVAGHDALLSRAEDNADDMLLVGQAQGVLMKARDLNAAEALLELFTRASSDRTELRDAAQKVIDEMGEAGRR